MPIEVGQRISKLTVTREINPRRFECRCDCGTVITAKTSELIPGKNGRIRRNSCGNYACHPARKDITGQQFGALTAIALTSEQRYGKRLWLFQCDCGRTVEKSLNQIDRGTALHCGDRSHGYWLKYPPTPTPYPDEALAIFKKWLHLTKPKKKRVDEEDLILEEMKIDKLMRAAWILAYRRSHGEVFDEDRERQYIKHTLKFCLKDLIAKKCKERADRYTEIEMIIGGKMTDSTSLEAVSTKGKTQPESILSKPRKRFGFMRR